MPDISAKRPVAPHHLFGAAKGDPSKTLREEERRLPRLIAEPSLCDRITFA